MQAWPNTHAHLPCLCTFCNTYIMKPICNVCTTDCIIHQSELLNNDSFDLFSQAHCIYWSIPCISGTHDTLVRLGKHTAKLEAPRWTLGPAPRHTHTPCSRISIMFITLNKMILAFYVLHTHFCAVFFSPYIFSIICMRLTHFSF